MTSRLRSPHALLAAVALASVAIVAPAAQAHADPVVSVDVQVTGGYNNTQNLGHLTGTISRVDSTFTYSLTACRQSSYTPPRGTIGGNWYGGSYGDPCPTYTGSFTQASTTVTLTFSGNTFYPGNTFTEYTKTRTYWLG
jgi:hypothetical protein